jgi:hypothetical protein
VFTTHFLDGRIGFLNRFTKGRERMLKPIRAHVFTRT